MKKHISIITVVVFMASLSVSAQTNREKALDNAVRNMEFTLKSNHQELISSTLINAVLLVRRYGVERAMELRDELIEVSISNESAANRYKAWLVLEVMKKPEILAEAPVYEIENSEDVFTYLNDKIQHLALKQ
ncbi:hypothetical protein EP331_08025 [bacterium]|nr:MAG: hypothetical protein EP331_08025 [bacterium]